LLHQGGAYKNLILAKLYRIKLPDILIEKEKRPPDIMGGLKL
jgi:hypothetical protein